MIKMCRVGSVEENCVLSDCRGLAEASDLCSDSSQWPAELECLESTTRVGAGRAFSEEVIAFTSDNEPYSVQAVIEPQWGSAGINMIISVMLEYNITDRLNMTTRISNLGKLSQQAN